MNNPIGIQFEKRSKRLKWNYVKTQFAPIHIHIAVVKLLQFVKSKYIPNLKVSDEGNYWETGDLEGLDERRELINRVMNLLEDGLKKIKVPVGAKRKENEIADIIKKIAREEVFPKLKKRKRK